MENNTQNQPAQPTLFQKLMQKLTSPCHNRNSKIAKKVLALAIAASMSLGALTACDLGNTPGTTPGTTPGGSIVTPGGNDSEYSALLDAVLSDSYYKTLMNQATNGQISLESAYFDPHPYSFLEKQGHDINSIKRGDLECTTYSFIKETEPNNLYIRTVVENPGEYYSQYLLSYALTDEEIADYEFLHGAGGLDDGYVESVFMNDMISKTKQPTIVINQNINKEDFIETRDYLNFKTTMNNRYGSTSLDVLHFNPNTSKNTLNYYYITTSENYHYMQSHGKLEMILRPAVISIKENILYSAMKHPASSEIIEPMTNIQIFSPQSNINKFDKFLANEKD